MDFRISEPTEVSCSQGSPPLAGCVLCAPILTVQGRIHGRVKLTSPGCTTAVCFIINLGLLEGI